MKKFMLKLLLIGLENESSVRHQRPGVGWIEKNYRNSNMLNPYPSLQTIPTDTWVKSTWEEFITFADDPTLTTGRFYYDEGYIRIEMAALGSAHGQDNNIISTVINLFATIKNIPIKGLTNTSFRKTGIRECQPDMAFYVGAALRFPPRNNAPVDLNEIDSPTLVVEVAASSLSDDIGRKQLLYERLGVKEYWVIDVNAGQVIAFAVAKGGSSRIQESQVLLGLQISLVEEAAKPE